MARIRFWKINLKECKYIGSQMGDELKFGDIFGQKWKNFWKSESQSEPKSRNSEKNQPKNLEAQEFPGWKKIWNFWTSEI